jgi:hypothetical protein
VDVVCTGESAGVARVIRQLAVDVQYATTATDA